jgi:nucleoside-diphosphate kinase
MDFIQKTVVLVKPDGVLRSLVGETIARFERVGLKLAALKMVWVDRDMVGKHYKDERAYMISVGQRTLDDYEKYGMDPNEKLGTRDAYEVGKFVRNANMDALSSGPVVAMIWEGVDAVQIGRKMIGSTNTSQAVPGTIRGDFSADMPIYATIKNRPIKTLVHASGNQEEADFEIKLWFKESEIYNYKMPFDED